MAAKNWRQIKWIDKSWGASEGKKWGRVDRLRVRESEKSDAGDRLRLLREERMVRFIVFL